MKAITDALIMDMIGRVYEAALDPGRWSAFLEPLTELVPNGKSALILIDDQADVCQCAAFAKFPEECVAEYNAHYGQLDPWRQRSHLVLPGAAMPGETILSNADLLRTEFYNDWLSPQDLHRTDFVIITRDHGRAMAVSLNCAEGADPSTTEHARKLLQYLVPHLRRSAEIHRQMNRAIMVGSAAEAALDHLTTGVFVIDGAGAVVHMNREARRIVAENDGLTVDRLGHLRAPDRRGQSELQRLIMEATHTGLRQGVGAGGAVCLLRPSQKPPLSLLVAPLPVVDRCQFTPWESAAVVFASDPVAKPRRPPVTMLMTQFGLTHREAMLLQLLVEGRRLEDAADELGIGIGTIRSHLKHLLQKLDCTRQSDLVRRALTSAAYVAGGV